MNLVDSSGWLEYFADGPNAGFFAPAIEQGDALLWTQDAGFEGLPQVRYRRAG